MAEHKRGYIAIIVLTFLAFIVTLFLSYLSSIPMLYDAFGKDIFQSTVGQISDEFYLEITPATWTFQIWILIYVFQLAWLIYALTLLCRKSNDWQGYLYYKPNFMPISLYVVYFINMALNIAWQITFDRKILEASSPILFGVSITLYICLFISYRALYREGPQLLRNGQKLEIGLVRALVQNGLATYAAWTSIASLLNFSQALAYRVLMDQEDASSVALGILALEIIGFFIVDNLLIDKYSRYTFMPYIVVVYALVGSMAKNWKFGTRNSTLTAVDLGLGVFALLIKVTMVIGRSRREPEPILRDVKDRSTAEN